jgi:hypothetical protein
MPMPFVTIMIALETGVRALLAGETFGADTPITVRQHRHREPTQDELNCLSIRFVSNDPSSQYGEQETSGGLPEAVWELSLDLVIDMALSPEARTPGDVGDDDPTGFGRHSEVLAEVLDWMFPGDATQDNTLGGLIWQARYDGSADTETDSTPDFARMEERLVLLYRVRADRPTELLTGD